MRRIILLMRSPRKTATPEELKEYCRISMDKLVKEKTGISYGRTKLLKTDKTVSILASRIKEFGKNATIVVDGFPKKIGEAKLIAKVIPIDEVIYLKNFTAEDADETDDILKFFKESNISVRIIDTKASDENEEEPA